MLLEAVEPTEEDASAAAAAAAAALPDNAVAVRWIDETELPQAAGDLSADDYHWHGDTQQNPPVQVAPAAVVVSDHTVAPTASTTSSKVVATTAATHYTLSDDDPAPCIDVGPEQPVVRAGEHVDPTLMVVVDNAAAAAAIPTTTGDDCSSSRHHVFDQSGGPQGAVVVVPTMVRTDPNSLHETKTTSTNCSKVDGDGGDGASKKDDPKPQLAAVMVTTTTGRKRMRRVGSVGVTEETSFTHHHSGGGKKSKGNDDHDDDATTTIATTSAAAARPLAGDAMTTIQNPSDVVEPTHHAMNMTTQDDSETNSQSRHGGGGGDGMLAMAPPAPPVTKTTIPAATATSSTGSGLVKVAPTKHDEKWNTMFERLVEYKEKHEGSTNVPQCYDDCPKLGRWVHYQRGTCILLVRGEKNNGGYVCSPFSGGNLITSRDLFLCLLVEYWIHQTTPGKGKITDERIQRLNTLGFEWDPQRAQWEVMFARLQTFHAAHGHCRVPKGYTSDRELANWVRNQRLEYTNLQRGKKSRMTAERLDRLNAMGFTWSQPAAKSAPNDKTNSMEGTGIVHTAVSVSDVND